MKTLIILALCAVPLLAQSPVNVSSGPPPAAWVSLYDYDGSGNLIYIGSAQQFIQLSTSITRAASTLTSIAVSSNTGTVTCATACGAWIGMRVTVTGATVDTDLNGSYTVLTTPTSTTYTITTANVANATYTESTLVISTNNPLTTASVWAIECLKYDVANKITGDSWAGSSVAPALAWTSRTSY